MDTATLYAQIASLGLNEAAHQFHSLVLCAQERHPHAAATRYLRPGDRCLDWGCGNGHFSIFLLQSGFAPEAFALDDAPPLLTRFGIPYTRGTDVVALPYQSGTFDAVFSVGVLEHVYERGGDERGSLTELARVLKPGGHVFVFHLPNILSWLETLISAAYKVGISKKLPHERRYSRAAFCDLVDGLGLELLEARRYHFLPRSTIARAPKPVRDSRTVCAAINAVDDLGAALLRPICQNWLFVLRKAR